jgi:galactokinase
MVNRELFETAAERFAAHFGQPHAAAAYAPGRIEVLGNHTDYNEGFVLSAAIDAGTFFLAAPSAGSVCRLVAGDLNEEVRFRVASPAPSPDTVWANYVKGVVAGLRRRSRFRKGFLGLFLGDVPLGAGLSSSAALEVSAGLALSALYGLEVPKLDLARIGQAAEHDFVGARCGLLDQITSLFARDRRLVMTDFRSLAVQSVPIGEKTVFLMCNTSVKHTLVDSEYNERRRRCEEATAFFASALGHPVAALRDVSWEEWKKHSPAMDPVTARRAAHVIGENARVLAGRELLAAGRLEEFGKLMFESHESSRKHFENSCRELDAIVRAARGIPGVMGARLSGGGFGGSAVVMAHPRDAQIAAHALRSAYEKDLGRSCDVRQVRPSGGAQVIAA